MNPANGLSQRYVSPGEMQSTYYNVITDCLPWQLPNPSCTTLTYLVKSRRTLRIIVTTVSTYSGYKYKQAELALQNFLSTIVLQLF